MMDHLKSARSGVIMGIAAYISWGLLPIYLKALHPLAPTSILSLRILWSLLFVVIVAVIMRRGRSILAIVRQPRLMALLLLSSLLIASNWLVYVIAVSAGHIVQTSLGYFINPLLNVALGVIFLRERLGRVELVAIALAASGVVVLTIYQQALPIMSLMLALTFGLYGLVRKMVPVDAVDGLLLETAILSPFALAWVLAQPLSLPVPGPSWPLVAASGILTAAPLLLFTAAAKRIRYADLALLQYLSPTLQLLLAVMLFGEPLLPIHLVAFGLIWAGLIVYAGAIWRRGQAALPTPPE